MIQQHACKYRVKTRAGDFTNLLSKSGGSELRHQQTFAGWRLASARFCQQSVKSLACFHTVVPDFLLDGGSLPPDFARGRCQTNYIANRHGFVKGGGERGVNKGRGVRRLPPPPPTRPFQLFLVWQNFGPLLSLVIPIGNIKKANGMRQPKSRELPGGKNVVQSSLLSFPWLPVRLRARK